jgi:hypothetical protein|nr:MAG TPA: Protein of unknown function (DUF3168) [Caudoviricetes sp.]
MGLTLDIMTQIRARLTTLTSTGASVKAFVGDPPSNPGLPFVFVWGPPTLATSEAVGGCGGDVDVRLHVQVVAATTANVLDLADQVTALLTGEVPTVPGWRCFPLEHVGVTDVRSDNSTVGAPANRAPRYCTVTFRAQATPETKEA